MTGATVEARTLPAGGGWRVPAAALALIVLADWLFYRHAIGASVVLFLAALVAAAAALNPPRASARDLAVAGALLLAAAVPILLAPTVLAMVFGVAAAAHFVVVASGQGREGLAGRVAGIADLLAQALWRPVGDAVRAFEAIGNGQKRVSGAGILVVWIVPFALGSLFLLLFASANPLIEDAIAALDLAALDRRRILFWALALFAVWPFVALRLRRMTLPAFLRPKTADARNTAPDAGTDIKADAGIGAVTGVDTGTGGLFGTAAILRSLVVFNLIFAVQTVLDLAYLWGGAELPDGMTYARYAHRGAYPLVAAALFAAAFVLAAMRPGRAPERSRPIRLLVFLWVGQTVLLVASSMFRLDLYVAVYSLTYLRVAALIWMALVAVGLLLILARIVLARSNLWLVGMNLGAAALTLWLCGFVNFPAVIADYNVDHSREISGEGRWLDVGYLLHLGPQALPALDRYGAAVAPERRVDLAAARDRLADRFRAAGTDWRGWSLRDQALAAYLAGAGPAWAAEGVAPAPASDAAPGASMPPESGSPY